MKKAKKVSPEVILIQKYGKKTIIELGNNLILIGSLFKYIKKLIILHKNKLDYRVIES